MIKKILVPIDGSSHSSKALDFACGLAKQFSASLSIVHAVKDEAAERQVMVMGTAHVALPADPEKVKEAAKPMIDAAIKQAEAAGCQVASSDSVAGSPAREILQCAENHDIDTIVMGSRGLSDFAGLLMGSVSHKVSHLAQCTCIIVR